MINNFEKFQKKSLSSQRKFIQNCLVFEKVSAFYIRIKVVSKNYIKFYKSDNKEIEQIDLLLNKMWKMPIDDFTKMFLSSETFMENSIGCTYSFFFFPVPKPLGIDYSESNGTISYRYILDNIKFPDNEIVNIGYITDFETIDTEHLIRKKGICLGKLYDIVSEELKNEVKSKDGNSLKEYIKSHTDTSNLCTKSIDESEGLVIKYKNEIFQIENNVFEKEKMVSENRIALEFFIHNFTSFISNYNFTECLTTNNYIYNVTSLFLKYHDWLEKDNRKMMFQYYNISAKDLAAPTFGYYGGTYFDLIPNKIVKGICIENPFYDNIYKILINGLRKEKKISNTPLLIMSNEDIEIWNNVVKIFSVYNKIYKK